jgi:HEAT repeat protein
VLLIVHGLSRAHDNVELLASASLHAVEIVIQNLNLSVDMINAETRLSMAVAEANMRSQHAGFSLILQPFTVCIELPRASSLTSI